MSFWLGPALQMWLGANERCSREPLHAQRAASCSRMGKDGERTSRTPSREKGVCDGVGQVEVRSGPEHLNHTQDFASELPRSNLRRGKSIL